MRVRPLVLGLVLLLAVGSFGSAFGADLRGGPRLQMYRATVDRVEVNRLVREGFDVAAERAVQGGIEVDLVLAPAERARLESRGLKLGLWRNREGKTATQLAAEQAAAGYTVYRSFDEPGGIRDELYQLAQRNRRIVKLVVLGRSIQGREIIALKVTRDATRVADGSRPAVLYTSNQHAREWISVEVNRRLLHYFVDGYGMNAQVTDLVNTRELWFVVSANPDGYQFTFDGDRLWRKNLRDNDGDGQITGADGVDPNRNFPEHWNFDDEGSSSQVSSETFRGAVPASEPETRAMIALFDRSKPELQVNWHSYGNLLLYTQGWQVQTPSADDPIYVALSGTDANPAIPGFDPGVGADLYTTNGETNDYAHGVRKTLSWTPELGEGIPGEGFVFPDDEGLVEAEFQKTLPFSLDVAVSAADPDDPVSHLGGTTQPFYLDVSAMDPQKAHNPLSDFRFAVSYGDPQPVQVLAKRALGAVALRYRINGGPTQTASTSEWQGGERFGDTYDVYYRLLRGNVRGTNPGDTVQVWFEGGGKVSDSFTYTAEVESSRRVLVMAAEDYSGISPVYKKVGGPSFLQYYVDALAANGVQADVYDVDAHGRVAPDSLGVLGHYDAVVWYTGDDIITRDRGMVPGTASRLANDEMLEVRAYLNEGGRLLYTGKYAGFEYAFGYEFDPFAGAACDPNTEDDGCLPLSDDFLQYYLGAYIYNDDAGTTSNGRLFDVVGSDTPFTGTRWSFGGPSANNQDHSASFLATSGILSPSAYPQFASAASATYDRPGGPFQPHTGLKYMYSQIGDISYKRITRTIDLSGQSTGNLSFWVSHDTEQDWDFVFVEAHTVGQDDWTTLPDLNGHTGTSTGDSCPEGWIEDLHPFLAHYQTLNADGSCSPRGTTGRWNASSGNSGGWQNWNVSLAPYAGRQVEVSIAYVSDWSVQGLGTFVDDIGVSTGAGTTSFEDDADAMDGWAVTGPAAGSSPNPNNFIRSDAGGFPEGAAITTEDTIYFGFGFEGIASPGARALVMKRAMDYLLR